MSERPFGHDRIGLKSALAILFLCVLWGGLTPSLKVSLAGLPPFAVAGWRFLLGMVAIWAWCRLGNIKLAVPLRAHLSLIPYALVFVLQITCVNFGTRITTSNFAVILLNTSPVFVAVLAHWLIPNDRLTVRKVIGLVLAFTGVVFIFLAPSTVEGLLLGNLLVLAGGFLLGVIHVYAKFLLRRLTAFQLVFWEFLYGILCFFALSFLLEPIDQYNVTRPVVLGVLYQGLVIAGFGFVSWVYLLQRFPASKMASFQFSIPIFGVILGWMLLGEAVTWRLVAGVSFVAIGIYEVSTSKESS